MTVILNENEWAKEMIQSQTLGVKPSETLVRVSRYYIDKGYSGKELRRVVESFLLRCNPSASLVKWDSTLDYAISRAEKHPAIQIDKICISNKEMKIIDSLDGRQLKRLAFTLLCLAKYWKIVNPNNDFWVNNKDSEIMRMANINTSIKRQSFMYYTLNEKGLIQFSKKVDNTNVRVCFVDENSSDDTALSVFDFRNLGYQYLKYHGEPYYECQNCGITVKCEHASGRHPKYCKECAVQIHLQQSVNSVMKRRRKDADSL